MELMGDTLLINSIPQFLDRIKMSDGKLYGLSPILIYESFNTVFEHKKIKDAYYKNFPKYGFDYGENSRSGKYASASGEYLGKSYLHKDPEFYCLFSFLKKNLIDYISKLGFRTDLFSYHVLKSWYVIITDNNGMQFHTHSGSDLSFCYYIDIPEGSGTINFLNQNPSNVNALFSGLFDYNPEEPTRTFIRDFNSHHTFYEFPFEAANAKLLIFPSKLQHSVDPGDKGVIRHSISGDIKLTLNEQVQDFESGLVHPSLWTEL